MSRQPPVFFLVLDSMRLDRVSHYGHKRETTPHLDQLAEQSTIFENAITPTPWTLPTHVSLFTGLFPSEHNVTNGIPDQNITIPDKLETLSENFHSPGYSTGAFVNNPWVGQTSGLDRGFEEYVEWDLDLLHQSGKIDYTKRDRLYSRFHRYLGHSVRHPFYIKKRRFFTRQLVDLAQRWFDKTDNSSTFTFMNLMEAHSPYFPPKSVFRELNLETPGLAEPRILNTKLLGYLNGQVDSDSIRPRIMEYYDASLRFQDRKVGELLAHLRDRDIFDDSLIIICSDHGKTLGDYNREAEPPHYLREININVPLLIKYPGQESGKQVERPVELTNVMDFLTSESDDVFESYQPMSDIAYFEDHIPHTSSDPEEISRWRGLCTTNYKYIREENGNEYLFSRGAEEKLVDSPEEETLSRVRSLLSERVDELNENAGGDDGRKLDELEDRTKAQLEDLGYMK